MSTLNILVENLILTTELTLKDYAVSGFFGVASFLLFIFLQLLGAKLFVKMTETGQVGPRVFALVLLILGVTGTVFSCFVSNDEASLVLGFTAGLLIWTALCDIPEQMNWISTHGRKAVLVFLPLVILWAVALIFFRKVPAAVYGASGYPLGVWGIQLTRFRVISEWGPSSLAATILILLTAAIAGGALALGIVHGTIFSGIIGGVIFAIATWSALEIIWERGMAQKPWRNSQIKR